jgi:sporulation protein YlmC with PRC-barrel domain
MATDKGVNTRETSDLIASDKVEGTAVMNRKGEKIGEIENVMIAKRSGKVAYAVMSFGGFLGIGERHHPVPWNALAYDTKLGGYVIDADRARLEGAPSYSDNEMPNWEDRQWGQRVHDYYGARPYWG